MKKIFTFFKKDLVMCISLILAVVSMFFVPPSTAYLDYIDCRTLSLLLCLMLVMAGLRSLGVFHSLGQALLKRCHTTRQVALVLILLCFFTSMLITNDVALITFVPFTIEILTLSREHRLSIPIIVMQTIAANLGSMLTPLGNPQNLYLYSLSGMDISSFIVTMLPYTLLSLILILLSCLLIPKSHIESAEHTVATSNKNACLLTCFYLLLFVLCLTCVIRILPFYLLLGIVLLLITIIDCKNLLRADYALLLTFIFLFIFIGNLSHIEWVNTQLANMIEGHELITAILSSQIISNVPSSILLSGFTTHYHDLLIGVNIGGLGTLIASMASLISFKQFCAVYGEKKGKYMCQFTLWNIAFLIILVILACIL